MTALAAALPAEIDDLADRLRDLRRDIHAHPELSWHERRTSDLLGEALSEQAGIRVTELPRTGVIADLGPADAAYRIALRADIDALPVVERTGLPWASTVDGVAHACGHDVHAAACLGAGLALARHTDSLERLGASVRLVFQPAEEMVPGGALQVIDGGWLDGVDEMYGLHCEPTLDVGSVGLRVGAITAATDAIEVSLHGRGGHTSRPHLTQDLAYALAKVVTEVPAALSRRVDPRLGMSLVWGAINTGGAPNVIPSSGIASGTLRVLDEQAWESAGPLVEQLVREVVAPYAVSCDVTYTRGIPPVVNGPEGVDVLRSAVAAAGERGVPVAQSLGGEDFAWYLTKVPGALARLGTRTPGGTTYDLHQGDFVIDERAVTGGARVLAGAVVAALAKMTARPDRRDASLR
ncbi:MAG: amidohydrolase [Dermatophilaceae bacterium]